tara:strand:+ start:901 stop:1653 length:753 start_codon:yes stop_codon:yes gene_type:complete
VEDLITLLLLILLQFVLGIDNLLYISFESKKVKPELQKKVRLYGIFGAVVLRILILVTILNIIKYFENPIFSLNNFIIEGTFNFHSLIIIIGGIFILYTSVTEIVLILLNNSSNDESNKRVSKSYFASLFSIILMNIVFSLDSILAAIALTDNYIVMSIAIIFGGLIMVFLADRVTDFLNKNRIYEVLGLFILFVVGIMLVSDGAYLADMKFFDQKIDKMSKSTFYFIITILILIDIVQNRYSKKQHIKK